MPFPLTDWICLNYKLVVVNVTSPFLLNSFSRLYHSFFTGKRIKTNPISLDFPRDFRLVFIISYGHSFASVAINNGADVASVSEKLGHADKSTTLRMYTHADEESVKRAGDIFRQALEAAGSSR